MCKKTMPVLIEKYRNIEDDELEELQEQKSKAKENGKNKYCSFNTCLY